MDNRSVDDAVLDCDDVRVVCASDGTRPRRHKASVAVRRGRLTVIQRVRYRNREMEQAFSFRLSRLGGCALFVWSWLSVVFDRPLPVTLASPSVRTADCRTPRLSIDPPWPLDFTLHLYQCPTFDVQSAFDLFVRSDTSSTC